MLLSSFDDLSNNRIMTKGPNHMKCRINENFLGL